MTDLAKLETVEFFVELDGARTPCLITVNALKSRFGATEGNAVRVLVTNFGEISAVAERVARHCVGAGRVVVRSSDFQGWDA